MNRKFAIGDGFCICKSSRHQDDYGLPPDYIGQQFTVKGYDFAYDTQEPSYKFGIGYIVPESMMVRA